ncbi:MAG: hypothetical protein O2779_01330 [Nanoarchaeota archaeon]|nr:hypothetical protein [Nanoarchaeota archaeon]
MKRKYLVGCLVVMLLVLIPAGMSISTYQETASVSRIVGESPTELLRQLNKDRLVIEEVTLFTNDFNTLKSRELLAKQFPERVKSNFNLNNRIVESYDKSDVEHAIESIDKNELFIIETESTIQPLKIKTKKLWDYIYPKDLTHWQESLEQKNPLLFLNAPHGGLYLPKQDTFASRVIKDAVLIAPSSFSSNQFTKSFLCQLYDGKKLGEVFKDARNFHYNGGSITGRHNYLGLILQSYNLFGNPLQDISLDWTESDYQDIKKKYCKNNLDNLETGIDYLGQVGNYSKFRKHISFTIESHSIDQMGTFAIVNASPAYQRNIPGELILPIAIRTTYFPKNTLITNFSIEEISNPVQLSVPNLPSYEGSFVNRTCYQDNQSASITFQNGYTQNQQKFIAEINPVEIINCTQGTFRLFKTFKYAIDYIAISPILIRDVSGPTTVHPKEILNYSIDITRLTIADINGTLLILDEENNTLYEKEIANLTKKIINVTLPAPKTEGIHKYSVEFMQNKQTVAFHPLTIETVILEPNLQPPITAQSTTELSLKLISHAENDIEVNGNWFLLKNTTAIQNSSFSKTTSPGSNTQQLTLENLKKSDQSYRLVIILDYENNKKTLNYLITTNNIPIPYTKKNESIVENETITIEVNSIDYDNDQLTTTFNDSRFTKQNNLLTWKTKLGDKGNYSVKLQVSDGYQAVEEIITFEVKGAFEGGTISTFADGSKNRSLDFGTQDKYTITLAIPEKSSIVEATIDVTAASNEITVVEGSELPDFKFTDGNAYSNTSINYENFTINIQNKKLQYLNLSYREGFLNCANTVCASVINDFVAVRVNINGKILCTNNRYTWSNRTCTQNTSLAREGINNGLNTITIYQIGPSCCGSGDLIDMIRLENPREYIKEKGTGSNKQQGTITVDVGAEGSQDSTFTWKHNETVNINLNAAAISNKMIDCINQSGSCIIPIGLETSDDVSITLDNLRLSYLALGKNESSISMLLDAGWNLLSFPFEITKSLLEEEPFTTSPENCITKIALYNSTSSKFKMMNKTDGAWGDVMLDEGQGYWIYTNSTCTLSLKGKSKSTIQMHIENGWNLMAFHAESKKSRSDVIQNVKYYIKKIMSYHEGNWYSYSPTRPEVLNTIKEFQPGWAYYIQYNGNDTATWGLDQNDQLQIISQHGRT